MKDCVKLLIKKFITLNFLIQITNLVINIQDFISISDSKSKGGEGAVFGVPINQTVEANRKRSTTGLLAVFSTTTDLADWIFQTFQQKTFSPRPPSPAGVTADPPLISLPSTRPGATTAWRAAPSGDPPGAQWPASHTPAVTPQNVSTLSPASPQWWRPALSKPG